MNNVAVDRQLYQTDGELTEELVRLAHCVVTAAHSLPLVRHCAGRKSKQLRYIMLVA